MSCSDDKKTKIKASLQTTKEKRQNQTIKVREVKLSSNKITEKQAERLALCFLEAKWFYNDIIRFAIQKVKTEGESIEDAINSAAAKYEINAEDLGMESLMKKVYHGVHKD